MSTGKTLTTANLVLITEAEDCVRRYVHKVADEHHPTYAFLINHEDIMDALGFEDPDPVMEFQQFRVYFGLGNAMMDYKMRLFLVPVDDSGHDIFPRDEDDRECVYDFNAPCPATCDQYSALYYKRFLVGE